MSGITQLIENAVVPLVLQLVDGATDQYPQCEIRDNDDNLLRTVDLIHAGSGLYTQDPLDLPDPYIMPDEVFIAITYIVYSDAGHTTVNTEYYFDVDVFILTENTDWTEDERKQIREAIGVDGDKVAAVNGQIQALPIANDIQLSGTHGGGSWETGAGGSDWGATEREQIRDALGIDGAKTKSVGGMMQKLKKLLEAILSYVS